jgi:hypothetical protein
MLAVLNCAKATGPKANKKRYPAQGSLSTEIVGTSVIAAYLRKSQPSEAMMRPRGTSGAFRSSVRGQGWRPALGTCPGGPQKLALILSQEYPLVGDHL